MAEPINFAEKRRERGLGVPPDRKPVLKDGGGDGTSGGMEQRLAVLETEMKHVKDNLTKLQALPADMAEVKTKIEHLPSKDWIATRLQIYLGAMVAVSVLAVAITKLIN